MAEPKYTKDMTIGEVLKDNPNAEVVFMGFGMHCCGCPVSQMETIEEAASVHEADVDDILFELNEMQDVYDCGCECGCGCMNGEECTCGDECDCKEDKE